MNFYHAQDQARKQTRWLVFLFILAVLSLIFITNLCVAVFVWYSDSGNYFQSSSNMSSAPNMLDLLMGIITGLGWEKFLWITLLVCGVVLMAMGFKWQSLRGGGRVVAESLGGKPLNPNSDDPNDRRLLNVVEEMALASGVPVPSVYVLDNESGINAFAAGYEIKDAVIGVTRGTLNSLNREQLQGVVAHEFSHILNGDMQLNLKIVAILNGILIIGSAGRMFLYYSTRRSYGRSRRNNNGLVVGILAFGVCLTVIGWLGQFFGSLIRSGVSRQREYLADASAVQFTRNPQGIGGALRTIGGGNEQSHIHHHSAHELGHFFFSSAYASFLSLFATHPPLNERIQRIMPSWDGSFLKPEQRQESELQGNISDEEIRTPLNAEGAYEFAAMASLDVDSNQVASNKNSQVPDALFDSEMTGALHRQAREPHGAVALVLALLLDQDEALKKQQMADLNLSEASWVALIEQTFATLNQLGSSHNLSLAELAIPALKMLSLTQYKLLRKQMTLLIKADGRVGLFEWVLYQLVRRYCDRHFGLAHAQKPKYKTIQSVAESYQKVLSRFVHYGCEDEAEKALAFNRGCNATGLHNISLLALEECPHNEFALAVHELSRAYPLIKPRMMKGLIKAAQTDSFINTHERQSITAIAAVMDCPLVGLDSI